MGEAAPAMKCRLRMDSITTGDFKRRGGFSSFRTVTKPDRRSLTWESSSPERPSAGFVATQSFQRRKP